MSTLELQGPHIVYNATVFDYPPYLFGGPSIKNNRGLINNSTAAPNYDTTGNITFHRIRQLPTSCEGRAAQFAQPAKSSQPARPIGLARQPEQPSQPDEASPGQPPPASPGRSARTADRPASPASPVRPATQARPATQSGPARTAGQGPAGPATRPAWAAPRPCQNAQGPGRNSTVNSIISKEKY